MPKLFTGAEIVFKSLEDQKVEYIFGYPGGAVLPIYDELKNHKKIKHVLARHEQGAGHAAEGYARSSGKAGNTSCNFWPRSHKCCYCFDRCIYGFHSTCLYIRTSAHPFNRD